jgi:hypothetical protein
MIRSMPAHSSVGIIYLCLVRNRIPARFLSPRYHAHVMFLAGCSMHVTVSFAVSTREDSYQPSRVHGRATNCCGLTPADLTARRHLLVPLFERSCTTNVDPIVIYLMDIV